MTASTTEETKEIQVFTDNRWPNEDLTTKVNSLEIDAKTILLKALEESLEE